MNSQPNQPTTSDASLEDEDVNYVTPHDLPSGHTNSAVQRNPLSTSYGVPLAQPIGQTDSGITNIVNSNGDVGSNQFSDIASGNHKTTKASTDVDNTSQKQDNPTFGISSSAVSGIQGTLVTNSFGILTSNSPPSYQQTTFSQNLPSTISPTIQSADVGKSNSFSNAIPSSIPQTNNFDSGDFPSQFQVITSLDPIPGAFNDQLLPQSQPGVKAQPASSDYTPKPQEGFTSSALSNSVTTRPINYSQGESTGFSSPSGPTVQSSIAETTFDSSLDTYGSPSAGPLSAESNNGFPNQQSADTSYGAPLAEPLDDGYGAPKAAPIDLSYGAPLAQPVSQSSYGAPKAAPLSRYQSKKNWPPPPPPPPASSISPFKSFSFGRSKRLQRYRHNFRNRFKRKFPNFLFQG